jgi:lipopolysaccharide transport system permease protein
MLNCLRQAIGDMRSSIRLHAVWMALAHENIGDQHRRTFLGPIWIVFNYLAFVGTFVFIFQRGDSGTLGYGAYVAISLLVWLFLTDTITQSVSLFVREESFIKGTVLPLSVYVLRLATQLAIRASYALVGCISILIVTGTSPSLAWIWSALALLLILAITPATIILFAFLGAYVPDSQFIVANLMRIGMFITPVFWEYEDSHGIRHIFYHYNPLTYFLEIVRVPILLGTPPAHAFLICTLIGLSIWCFALLTLGRYRKRLVFVL